MTPTKRAPEGAPEFPCVNNTDNIGSLPAIQADPRAERAFAYQLAAVVFGKPVVPVVERKRRRVTTWRPAR